MQVSPTVHTALATALLIVSLVRFELSRRALWGSSSNLALELAVSVPKDLLLTAYMGLSWAGTNDPPRELVLGIASMFAFLPVSLRMSILLQSLISTPSQLRICYSVYYVFSSSVKIISTVVGTYVYPPLQGVVLFLHFVDYLSLASLLWWLHGYTTTHSQTRLQLHCALLCTTGLAAVLLLVAIFGVVRNCWLLSLELQLCVLTTWMIISYYIVQNAGSSVAEPSTCSTIVVNRLV